MPREYGSEMETTAGCCCNGLVMAARPVMVAEVGGGGAFTVIDTVAWATSGFGLESLTENMIEVVPTGAVVVPNSIQVVVVFVVLVDGIQVAGSSLSPTGNKLPGTMAQVYGPTPPLTVPSDCVIAVPSVIVRGEEVMVSTPATVIVSCCCVVTGAAPADAGV
jgi:hypothetical protein